MSTRIVTLSRSGLSACPACHEHTFVDAADAANARCRSCGEELAVSESSGQRVSRRRMFAQALGRGAAVALFLGVATAGCKTTQTTRETNDTGGGGAPPPERDAGHKSDVTIRPAPEPGPQPEYGVPMEPPE